MLSFSRESIKYSVVFYTKGYKTRYLMPEIVYPGVSAKASSWLVSLYYCSNLTKTWLRNRKKTFEWGENSAENKTMKSVFRALRRARE